MFGCESRVIAHVSEAAVDSTLVEVAGGSCAASESHDCCAKSARKTPVQSSEESNTTTAAITSGKSSSDAMKNCPLAVNVTAVIPSYGSDQPQLVLQTEATEFFRINSLEHLPPQTPLAHLLNRDHTYLRCCAFLI